MPSFLSIIAGCSKVNMTSSIQRTLDAALKIFTRRAGAALSHDNITEIKGHVNTVSKTDLDLDRQLLDRGPPDRDDPPVTYVRIVESKLMTVAVFILRQGRQLPLHDHPDMNGFLKVVHGSVTINRYTPLDPNLHPIPTTLSNRLAARYGRFIPAFPSRFDGTSVVSDSDECCVISPDGSNIHEIKASGGTAAFLDILSPPYDHKSMFKSRPCNYYMEVEKDEEDPSIRYLVQINAPNDYWCDEVPYTGPDVSKYS